MAVSNRSFTPLSWDRYLANYLHEVRKFPMLEPDEEYMLVRRWSEHKDRRAADRLVTSHLRLVVKIAAGFRGYGLPISDLIAEGNVGMMRAINGFDPNRGFRLATYAVWWIRAAIQEYILHSWSLVKIGTTASQRKLFFKLRRVKEQIKAIEEGDLSPEQVTRIAERLAVSADEVVSMNRRLAEPDTSLNAPLKGGSEGQWQDWLVDDRPSQEAELAEHEEMSQRRQLLGKALATLNERERHILVERHLTEEPPTLDVLGKAYGISPERVRQIEVVAYRKLQKAVRTAPGTHVIPAGRSRPAIAQAARSLASSAA
ncbi:MAG TPA: RNA polymerase sigma factor RpoH [Dongiaceae bacterium]|jgi:RNA polymerase sigma-32 factor|nr:RNA polymerase sigma factor RpoH [Dongiaceae bacterium]